MDRSRTFIPITGFLSVLLLSACGGEQHEPADTTATETKTTAGQQGQAAGGADDHSHDNEVVIGTASIGEWEASPHRFAPIVAGKELAAGVDLVPADPQPTAVRMWVGIESGRGSIKAKADPESAHPGGWHGHLMVPDPVPAEAQFWVELETAEGRLTKGFPIEVVASGAGTAHDHGDHDHGDHDHGDHSH